MTKEQIPQDANEGTNGPSRSTVGLERILDMAKMAFANRRAVDEWFKEAAPNFEAFARMIAFEEREACAMLCDEIANATQPDDFALDAANDIAAAIRMRSNVKVTGSPALSASPCGLPG